MTMITRYEVRGHEPGPYPKAPTPEWRVVKAIADMLRYDGATVEKIEFKPSKKFARKMIFIATCRCYEYPSEGRWNSFQYYITVLDSTTMPAKQASQFCADNIRRAKQVLGYPERELR